ncbi:MAG: undecaprenyl-diphosphate phosphatase [Candidatus Aminicenantes bacterium]|nr:undecaprenyl-diphosphate phosphatase [Candidatus Aminicenantes bacterium]
MTWLEALILGVIQGLTEFLPVSSSGHLEIGRALLGRSVEQGLPFVIAVHGATVLAVIVVFWPDILRLARGALSRGPNAEKSYGFKLLLSMIPILLVGLFLRDRVEAFFTGNLAAVGIFFLVTSSFLAAAHFRSPGRREINAGDALLMGAAQAVAVLPGISRSGAVISAGMLAGARRDELARFAFLMSVVPILGANILEAAGGGFAGASLAPGPLAAGFLAAFITGILACRLMVALVRRGKLIFFSLYCVAAGVLSLVLS